MTPLAGPWQADSGLHPERLYRGLSSKKLPGLDGLRAVAALAVVLNHADVPLVSGGLGVLAFFVLSGFLITWLLLIEDDRCGNISLKFFYIRRSLRIFPAFYCYWTLVVLLMLLTHRQVIWPEALSALMYVSNYYHALQAPVNTPLSHSWSLGVEEQFYLLWPLGFSILKKDGTRMAWTLTTVILTVWVYRTGVHVLGVTSPMYVQHAFDTRVDHLLVGCLLAVLLHAGLVSRTFRLLTGNALLSVGTLSLLIASVWVGRALGNNYKHTVGFALEPVLVAVLIVQMIALKDNPLWRWTNWRCVTYLGTISYSMYLYQQVVPGTVFRALAGYPFALQVAVMLAGVIALASGSYWLVERPFLNRKERFTAH